MNVLGFLKPWLRLGSNGREGLGTTAGADSKLGKKWQRKAWYQDNGA